MPSQYQAKKNLKLQRKADRQARIDSIQLSGYDDLPETLSAPAAFWGNTKRFVKGLKSDAIIPYVVAPIMISSFVLGPLALLAPIGVFTIVGAFDTATNPYSKAQVREKIYKKSEAFEKKLMNKFESQRKTEGI